MLFVLSKLIAYLMDPLLWIVVGIVYGLWAKKSKKSTLILKTSVVFLLLLSSPLLSNYALKQWEWPAMEKANLPFCDIGIVLTGMTHSDYKPEDQIHFSESADRITEALILYRSGLISKILITGGSSKISGDKASETEQILPLVLAAKINEKDLLIEDQARNTYENARLSTEMLTDYELQDRRALLITSAFHMRRSMACFKKQGLDVVPYPVDFRSETVDLDLMWLLPSAQAFSDWKMLIKEWIGLLSYKLVGYA